tara:strand:+ start:9290 stop:10534 length:1245 start_codon:yes stop_codon:yes gene_type:complete
MNISKIVNHIQDLELECHLYGDDILSRVWKSIRTNIYYSLQQDLDIFAAVKPRNSFKNKLVTIYLVLVNSVFRRPKILASHKQLVIQHPRTKKKGGLGIDPYSFKFTRDIAASSLFLSRSSLGEKNKKLLADSASMDCLLISKMLKRHKVGGNEVEKANNLMAKLCNNLGVEASRYQKKFVTAISDFLVEEAYFSKLLTNTNIETVYLVDHYSKNVALISACKKLDVRVVEFQHGIISKYHLGYSVIKPELNWACYPDLFLAWGEHWVNNTELPKSVDISYISPAYLNEKIDVEKKNQLVIVSQSVIGKQIAGFVVDHIDVSAFDTLIFKLHPSEVDLLPYYQKVFENSPINVSVEDIYPLLNESKCVLGVFSTVMLEAVDFACDVFYIDLPGSEYIQSNSMIKDVKKEPFYVG